MGDMMEGFHLALGRKFHQARLLCILWIHLFLGIYFYQVSKSCHVLYEIISTIFRKYVPIIHRDAGHCVRSNSSDQVYVPCPQLFNVTRYSRKHYDKSDLAQHCY